MNLTDEEKYAIEVYSKITSHCRYCMACAGGTGNPGRKVQDVVNELKKRLLLVDASFN